MNLDKFTGSGSTPSRRRFWDKVQKVVMASRKTQGRNASVDEREEQGTTINFPDQTPSIEVVGACCYDDGTCDDITEADCDEAMGNWQGPDTTCDDEGVCVGACCIDGVCYPDMTKGDCETAGGNFLDFGSDCEGVDCTQGACCLDGNCTITTEEECEGIYQGNGTTCEDIDCTKGACCDEDGNCTITTEEECDGTWQGAGTMCDPNPCPIISPCCDDSGTSGFIDPTTKFLTVTKHYTYSDADSLGAHCTSSWDYTSIYITDPVTCETTVTCFGSGSFQSDIVPDGVSWNWELNGITHDCACSHTTPDGYVCAPCEFDGPCGGLSDGDTVISNTVKRTDCTFNDEFTGFSSAGTFTVTLSNHCTQSEMSPPP